MLSHIFIAEISKGIGVLVFQILNKIVFFNQYACAIKCHTHRKISLGMGTVPLATAFSITSQSSTLTSCKGCPSSSL